ncbi:DUF3467 domain-containing protein [Magnetococcus sp. PR-3]|uniref:DUF3467 domain-containing protein n=1 Tax=Magnetococcus sp. PR-3 TaxID=3120355 RepID=UPI002FCE6695
MAEENAETKVAPEGAGNPSIVWDDSSMDTTYANVCNVLGTREEIMVLFGANQAWQADSKEVTVNLSNRVVLNPYAAKRLQAMLDMALKEYETRYGQLKI